MEQISLGKLRGLQQCSTPRNVLAVLAMDHRNNLRHALNLRRRTVFQMQIWLLLNMR